MEGKEAEVLFIFATNVTQAKVNDVNIIFLKILTNQITMVLLSCTEAMFSMTLLSSARVHQI